MAAITNQSFMGSTDQPGNFSRSRFFFLATIKWCVFTHGKHHLIGATTVVAW